MKTVLLVVATLALALTVAEPAAATCYTHQHNVDPYEKETGTVIDAIALTFEHVHCEGPPPE